MGTNKAIGGGLRRDLAVALFFSALIPVSIAGALLFSQIRNSEQRVQMEKEKTIQQVRSSVVPLLFLAKIACEGVASSSELLDFLSSPSSLRRFSENRLFGRVSEWMGRAPLAMSWVVKDRSGAVLFQRGERATSSRPLPEQGAFLSDDRRTIQIRRNIHFDDQGLAGPTAAIDGDLECSIGIADLQRADGRIAGIEKIPDKENFDKIELRVVEPDLQGRGRFWAFLITVAAFLLASTAAGFAWLRRKVLLPIEDLTFRIGEKRSLALEGGGRNEIDLLENTVKVYLEETEKRQQEVIRQREVEALGRIAAQVAHDIRSPLAALEMVSGSLDHLEEDLRVLTRSAIGRIRDIANNLLEKNNQMEKERRGGHVENHEDALMPELLSSLIDSLISEKRLQYRAKIGISIEEQFSSQAYGIFAKVQPREFKRILSNLINNSVEAMDEKGTVNVSLATVDGYCSIEIKDDGKGIPPEVLNKVGELGQTFGKTEGSGMGLYHARSCLQRWGGNLKIFSLDNSGTTVVIRLPRTDAPEWFVSEIDLKYGSPVLIVDDDLSIHQVWQGRFDGLLLCDQKIEVIHFSIPDDIRKWVRENSYERKRAIFLMDHELRGHEKTGLDLIEELDLGERAILVTSHYDEPNIRARCLKLKTKLLPKWLAGFVPITVDRRLD